MATKLYLGTESGILVLEQVDGTWRKAGSALDGKFVEKLEMTLEGRLAQGALDYIIMPGPKE